jgi:hypothetical protein
MKTTWRFFSLLLSLLLIGGALVACSPTADSKDPSDSTDTGTPSGDTTSYTNGLKFKLNSDNTAYDVVGYVGTSGKVTVPSQYQGKPVTAIADSAFKENSLIYILTLPDTIVSIGDSAFYCCRNLESITLECGLADIGDSAFEGCTRLTEIALPETLMTIGDFAFSASGLKSVYIPANVFEIGRGAFSACEKLSTIRVSQSNVCYHVEENALIRTEEKLLIAVSTDYIIPVGGSVTEIGDNVFAYCYQLTEILIPDEVTKIGNNAFYGCENLARIVIPDGVTEIGSDAFAFCHFLQQIEIPQSVTMIGEKAFRSCKSLLEITLHAGITDIGDGAFRNCERLVRFVFVGTEQEWEQISFGDAWDENTGEYTIDFSENS